MHDDRSSPVTADAILADIVEHWENLKRDEGAFPPGDRRAAMSEHRLWHSIQSAKAWLRAPAQSPLTKRPVAWRCKDYADGWIIFQDEAAAYKYHTETDCMMQGMYVRDASPVTSTVGAAQCVLDPAAKGPDDCAEYMLLQARYKGQPQWTNIYAAQLPQFIGYGCEVRALSVTSTEQHHTENTEGGARWSAVDEIGNDNFATSIYEEGHKGLLVARCNQNGQYPWQGPAIIRGLEKNKAIAVTRPDGGEVLK